MNTIICAMLAGVVTCVPAKPGTYAEGAVHQIGQAELDLMRAAWRLLCQRSRDDHAEFCADMAQLNSHSADNVGR